MDRGASSFALMATEDRSKIARSFPLWQGTIIKFNNYHSQGMSKAQAAECRRARSPENRLQPPSAKHAIPCLFNLRLADIKSIGAMKMEVMMRRSNFRDYYDIYSILKEGVPIKDMITLALDYSGHRLKRKNLLAMLTNGTRFMRDAHFEQLSPLYQVTAEEIELYIKSCLTATL